MDRRALLGQWLREQEIAHIKGWDFSHVQGKYQEEGGPPWDFRQIIRSHLKETDRLLDMETGGGESLLSLCQ